MRRSGRARSWILDGWRKFMTDSPWRSSSRLGIRRSVDVDVSYCEKVPLTG